MPFSFFISSANSALSSGVSVPGGASSTTVTALRFTRLSERVGGISQKMLTQTLRGMERDGLVVRKVYPVVPPKVEYSLTTLGFTLGAAFCGVWVWAADNLEEIEQARADFDLRCNTES
ncbi:MULTISPECIES: winged helix-turn-helix transcriptional regulator [unclassified Pseudomonas]|uniref:winged helix-turn-helix transcriptional regulator n=1 Tax=unclassified Pseudomonas TaxID=196821 RepID=UPI00028825CB|nr:MULTISPECIES: helix-turn-helix domain-containing protein [unclassified Pseudomonas]